MTRTKRSERLDDLDALLRALSNETRRRIIELLSDSPMYVRELHEELNIGIQAIIKHLSMLEGCGLLSPYFKDSPKGPPRKYYRITQGSRLAIVLSPLGLSVLNPPPLPSEQEAQFSDLEDIEERLSEIQTLRERLEKSLETLEEIMKTNRKTVKELKDLEKRIEKRI